MAYEQKDNSGSLFRNDRKSEDTHADYTGRALLHGVEHWVDAWVHVSASGVKYMSLKFKPKEQREAPAPQAHSTALDDDFVPF